MPGSGITPFNIGHLELRWWRAYRAGTQQLIDAEKERHQAQKNTRRK